MAKKIAIAGYGIEGKSNFAYWNKDGNDVTIVDERESIDDLPTGAKTILGKGSFEQLKDFDLVIRTASLPPRNITTSGKIWSSTNEFFVTCPATVIGVTGTKGKGTTCSMIASMLRAGGRTVHLVGNIGVAALGALPDIKAEDIVVYELSSFQLWDLEVSPKVAVVVGIEPDHLDVHSSMQEYVGAKANIRVHQKPEDICFYNPKSVLSAEIATLLPGAKRYGIQEDGAAFVRDGSFYQQSGIICSTDAVQLPGVHNIENACAALSVASLFVQDTVLLEEGLREFTGLPHRIKYVREHNGVKFYDDSYSSAPGATIAAIHAFSEPEVVIIGGYDRGIDFSELAQAMANKTNIRKLVLIGQTRHLIAEALASQGVADELFVVVEKEDFSAIVAEAAAYAKAGDVLILSPACASFDMFKNFTDRGEQFNQIVGSL